MLPVDPETQKFIEKLDPSRDYGELSFDDVVRGIRTGAITASEGNHLPQLKDSTTGRAIKGTGAPPQGAAPIQQIAINDFRKMAFDDLEFAYGTLINGMRKGDPRYDKIFWELLVGKQGELRGGGMITEALKVVMEAMQTPEVRQATIEAYEVHD